MTDSCLYYFEYTTVRTAPLPLHTDAQVLDFNVLFHLLHPQDKDPIGIIPLENLCVEKLCDSSKPVECLLPLLSRCTHTHTHTMKHMHAVTPSCRVFEQYCLELFNPKGQKIKACKTENKGRVVQGKHQSYKLSAAGPEERDAWISAIR